MEDKVLLRLLQKDGERGLSAALDAYGGLVKTIVLRVLYDFPEDAEECISDTFLKLWKNARRLSGKPLRAWLIVTARNTAIDRIRHLNRTQNVPLTEDIAAAMPEEDISTLLESLSGTDRDIFIRKYYFLETSAEIAKATGRTEGDVNTRLSRGRKHLRTLLLSEAAPEF